MRVPPLLILALTTAMGLTGCGAEDDAAHPSRSSALEAVAADVEELPCAEPIDAPGDDEADADADEDAICANGYCCNLNTGVVSKTSRAGCAHRYYPTFAQCVANPVCNCRIN